MTYNTILLITTHIKDLDCSQDNAYGTHIVWVLA